MAGLMDLLGDVFDEFGDALARAAAVRACGARCCASIAMTASFHPGWVGSRGFAGSVRLAAEESPVLVAVDDLQWLDPRDCRRR